MVSMRRRSRLPRSIQIELIKFFVAGSTARSAAALTVVNRHTATLYFHKLRELIAEQLDAMAPDGKGACKSSHGSGGMIQLRAA